MKQAMNLIQVWKRYKPKLPYVLPDDESIMKKQQCSIEVWKDQIRKTDFLDPKNNDLFQLGYLPVPFAGNLKKASIFILMLNPGFGPADSYAEGHSRKFNKALRECLNQTSKAYFYALDPQFSWTGAFYYWHKKLEKLILKIATIKGTSFSEARRFLADHLACIEMVPYHSGSFNSSGKLLDHLHSANLAKNFVRKNLYKKAANGEILIVVTRKIDSWGLRPIKNKVVNYTGGEARGAHLTPSSKGGGAIIDFLKRKYLLGIK